MPAHGHAGFHRLAAGGTLLHGGQLDQPGAVQAQLPGGAPLHIGNQLRAIGGARVERIRRFHLLAEKGVAARGGIAQLFGERGVCGTQEDAEAPQVRVRIVLREHGFGDQTRGPVTLAFAVVAHVVHLGAAVDAGEGAGISRRACGNGVQPQAGLVGVEGLIGDVGNHRPVIAVHIGFLFVHLGDSSSGGQTMRPSGSGHGFTTW